MFRGGDDEQKHKHVYRWVNGIDKNGCVTCYNCVDNCSTGAISIVNDAADINPSRCIYCSYCEGFCPVGAIDIDHLF